MVAVDFFPNHDKDFARLSLKTYLELIQSETVRFDNCIAAKMISYALAKNVMAIRTSSAISPRTLLSCPSWADRTL